MKAKRKAGSIASLSVALVLLGALPGFAQTFSSGSTGELGAFAPSCAPTPCTVTPPVTLPPGGVLNFTTVNIPAGVTVTFARNAANTPVTILATSDVTIAGTISIIGGNGGTSPGPIVPGGTGGPGGFAGGNGGGQAGSSPPSAGQGPGGGPAGSYFTNNASYGAPSSFASLLPLVGGSGGGGSFGFVAFGTFQVPGASGGGGGGAIVIASSTKIVVTGTISANGGTGGDNSFAGTSACGGNGSGGAIRLVSPQITGSGGTVSASGGCCAGSPFGFTFCGIPGGSGRIRIEASDFAGLILATQNPTPSFVTAPGPVTTASNPALINLPTLTITSVGGIAAPATPGGSYSTPDMSLPQGTTNPVTVIVTATNIPLGTGTSVTLRLIPQFGNFSNGTLVSQTGNSSVSTTTFTVSFPSGKVSVLNAFASFTLPQTASLFPQIDGEPVERVMVAANYGEPSTVTLVTKSGKEVRMDTLTAEVQLAFAKGLEAMQRER